MSWFKNNQFEVDEIAVAKVFCAVCVAIGLFGYL